MFVLLEYNENYLENIKELKKLDYIPIILFKIVLNNKNQIKEDLQKLLDLKAKIKPKYTALQITLEKIENSTIGTVNNMKNNFDIIIGLGGLNKANRFFLESTQIDFLQDPQNTLFFSKIDFIHHFNSGINHILCNFAKEKETGFIFSLNFIYGNKTYIPKEIGRINQNLRFARKYNIDIYLNFIIKYPNQIKSLKEIENMLSIFDLSNDQKKNSLNILDLKIKNNEMKKTKKFICSEIILK